RQQAGIAEIQEAIRIRPDFALAHNNLIILYYEVGEYSKGWRHVHRARECGIEVKEDTVQALAMEMPDPMEASPQPEDDRAEGDER
ncbi:MAG: hypothetical protein ACYSVY_29620, partial [Planctomycetota bacterium]